MNTRFCRIDENGILEFAPDHFAGSPDAPTDAQYLAKGWYYNFTDVDKPEPPDGMMVVRVRFEIVGDEIHTRYDYEPIPARVETYSKLRVILALKRIGKWADVKDWIAAHGLDDEWQAAQELASDYEGFSGIVAAVCADCQITDEQIDAVLAEARL